MDLPGETIERHTEPSGGYGLVRRARRGDLLRPEGLPDLDLAVDAILA